MKTKKSNNDEAYNIDDSEELSEELEDKKSSRFNRLIKNGKKNTKKYVFGERKTELKTYKSTTLYLVCVVLFLIYLMLTYL